jgi:hypothetical protein
MGDIGGLCASTSETDAFASTVERVRAYVRSEPGAWSALSEIAREDPERTTRALLTLGTVLLDIAADAFDLTPDQMLGKVTRTIDLHRLEESRHADSR